MSRYLPLVLLSALSLSFPLLPWAPVQAQTTASAPVRVVVLPFRNLNSGGEDNWLGESFSESLTVALSQSSSLELVERSQLEMVIREQGLGQTAFADESTSPRLGRLMGARHLLVGSYQKQGERLQVQARLVDSETGQVLQGRAVQLDGDYNQIFGLQAQLAQALLRQLGATAPPPETLAKQLKICASSAAYAPYRQGLSLMRQRGDLHLRQAALAFEEAIRQDPEFTLAYVALSELLSWRAAQPSFYPSSRPDDLSRAVAYAEQALQHQRYPATAEVYRALALAQLARDQFAEAQQAIERSLQEKPGDTDSILVYLELQSAQHADLQALESQLRRYGANLQDPWVRFALAITYLHDYQHQSQRDFGAAMELLQSVHAELPQHTMVLVKMAWVESLRKRYAETQRYLNQALTLEPDNYMLHYKAGLLLSGAPAYREAAAAHLRRSLALLPDFGEAEIQLAQLAQLQNQPEMARQHLLTARRRLPDSALVLTRLGLLAESQQQLPEAYAYLLQARERFGQRMGEALYRGEINLHLARVAQAQQRADLASAHFEAALQEARQENAGLYPLLIRQQLDYRDYTRAESLFRAYQSRVNGRLSATDQGLYRWIYLLQQHTQRPDDPAILNDLGAIYLGESRLAEAASYLEKAHSLAPQQTAIAFNLGLLYREQGRLAEAQSLLANVTRQDPQHRNAWFYLGQVQQEQGERAAARQSWQSLLSRWPTDQEALTALEQL
ncbi:MAG: FlgO family outer membrane protein [Candidatus Sericytochromatia bacterium]